MHETLCCSKLLDTIKIVEKLFYLRSDLHLYLSTNTGSKRQRNYGQ